MLLKPPRLSHEITTPKTPVSGPEDAELRIVEFSDFQCPFCARIQLALAELKEQYGAHISIAFKHFPINTHRDAEWLARLSECARQHNKFWDLHDLLFFHQNDLTPPKALGYAMDTGLDENYINACIDSKETLQAVAEDKEAGWRVGVTGTPTFIVNGRLVLSPQSLKAVIDEEWTRILPGKPVHPETGHMTGKREAQHAQ